MDNLVLEALVGELRPILIGAPVFRAAAGAGDEGVLAETLVLLFDDRARSRLLVSVSPALPRLHLTWARASRRGRKAGGETPTRTGATPTQLLRGEGVGGQVEAPEIGALGRHSSKGAAGDGSSNPTSGYPASLADARSPGPADGGSALAHSAFSALVAHHLGGAILAAIEKEPCERIVRLRFAGAATPGKILVIELLGRSSNLLLLDPAERILGFARSMNSSFRRPQTGEPYAPPRPRPRDGAAGGRAGGDEKRQDARPGDLPRTLAGPGRGVDPRTLTEEAVAGLVERSQREAHPLADLLLEACAPLGSLAAREIEHRAGAGEPAFSVLREWLERAFAAGGACGRAGVGLHEAGVREPEGSVHTIYNSGPKGEGGSQKRTVNERGLDGSAPEQGEGPAPEDTGCGVHSLGPSARSAAAPEADPSGTRNPGRPEAPGADAGARAGARGFIYAECPPEQLDTRRAAGAERYILSPLALASAARDLTCFPYASLNAAADAFYGPLAAGIAFRTRRDGLLGIARREAKRAGDIALKVAQDLRSMEKAGRYRLYGEALLAGLTQAERHGGEVVVPDPYDAEGGTLSVPIDPAFTLPHNAERYFQRHRKAERGRAVAEKRLTEQSRRADEMLRLAGRIEEAPGDSELEQAEEELRGQGIAVGLARTRKAPRSTQRSGPRAGGRAQPVAEGIRIYTCSFGYDFLVGKGSKEHDRLTFKIAAPEDFWLHASGAAGAHVVVRPRQGGPAIGKTSSATRGQPAGGSAGGATSGLPPATLREAAALAAFFSKAKGETRAEVMVTRRKYVRRIRGAPRGTVTVKKHETIAVAPRNPFE